MLQVHDTVVYGVNGVCTVTDITTRVFAKEKKEYYVLSPLAQHGSLIYIPTDSAPLLSKIRRVLTADEIRALLSAIGAEPCLPWQTDETKRRAEFREILQSMDRRRLLCLIKTIYQHGQEQKANGRKLHHADEQVMKEAEGLLIDEFSYALAIEADAVMPLIIEHMNT